MKVKVNDFSLDKTLPSGQTFGWKKVGDSWVSFFDRPIKVTQKTDSSLEFSGSTENMVKDMLGLNDDIERIKSEINKDEFIDQAINYSLGLRIVKDGLWASTLGFILSIQSNIPLITRRIRLMSEYYGEKKDISGIELSQFPKYDKIYERGYDALKKFKLGFRTKFVFSAARYFYSHEINEGMDLEEIKKHLLSIDGVGPKVLDCITLYGLHELSSFPMDVWIQRTIAKYYYKIIGNAKSYKNKNKIMRDYFGQYSGYAQLFMFNYSRMNNSTGSI